MKTKYIIAGVLSLFLSHAVLAEDSCIVIGFHEPNSQIYDGPTFCTNVTIKNIVVRGPLTVTHSKLIGSTTVSGPIKASHTQFDQITVKNLFSKMIVRLKDASVDKGDLVFSGSSGFYDLDRTSIVCGKIVNGTPYPSSVK